jgi:hypothetical protein
MSNGLSGAGFGMFCGAMALLYVLVVRVARIGDARKPAISLLGLALVYLVGGPALGFVGSAARTWLRGRWGRYTIGIGLAAIGGAMATPLIPGTKFPWGGLEYSVIVVSALTLGPLLAAYHNDEQNK